MIFCASCGLETSNPKYCSNRCAGKVNGALFPKRKRIVRKCSDCSGPAEYHKRRCEPCRIKVREENRLKQVVRATKATTKWRREQKQKAVEYKGGKCFKCGYDKCIWALQFHHRDPHMKSFSISSKTKKRWELVQPELDKCDLLCANCHFEIESLMSGLTG